MKLKSISHKKTLLLKCLISLTVILLCLLIPTYAFAHSGRTDARGGHRDNKNKSGLGSYHYHCGGYPAHLHKNGVCPYNGGGSDVDDTPVYTQAPTTQKPKPKINNAKTSMGIGDEQTLSVTADGISIYSYQSSNPKVADIEDGKIKAKAAGKCTITVEAYNGEKAEFTLTVKEVLAKKIELKTNSISLLVGDTYKVDYKISPDNTTNKNVTWSSKDENIATVSKGQIKGISVGNTVITVKNGEISSQIKVKVNPIIPKGIEITAPDNKLELKKAMMLSAVITPQNSTDSNVTWRPLTPELAQISSDGEITALSEGAAKFEVKTSNGITNAITIDIYRVKVEKVEFDMQNQPGFFLFDNYYMDINDTIDLNAKLTPDNATYQNIMWKEIQNNILEITGNSVSCKTSGETTLTATSYDGANNSIKIVCINFGFYVWIIIAAFAAICLFIVFIVVKRRKR